MGKECDTDGFGSYRLTEIAHIKFSGVDKKVVAGEILVKLCNYRDVFYNRYIKNKMQFMQATATQSEIENFALKKGDVLFTKDSETAEDIAICASVEDELDNVICGYHLGIARPKNEIVIASYLAEVLNYHPIHSQFVRLANGVTRFGLTLSAMEEITLPLPTKKEQEIIMNILLKWDTAIGKTEKLIEAKMLRHAALSNKLLSRKFNAVSLKAFLKPTLRAISRPTKPYWALGIRSHGKGTFRRFVENPNSVVMDTLYRVKREDLIVNITFAWEGAIAFVGQTDEDCFVSHRFPTYEVNINKALPDYLRHVIVQKRFIRNLGLISPGGAGRNRVLNKTDFLNLKITLPIVEEQKIIGDTLNTSLKEISLLKTKLELLKKQKRGLMQKLLTGQWRVKTKEGER